MSEETLQIAEKRREAKGKGEKENYTHLNAEFQRIARRDKKAFFSDQRKEIEKNNRMGKTVDLFKKRQRNQRSNCQHLLDHGKGKRVPEKHLHCFIEYTKAFYCVDHNKLWKILQKIGLPDHLTCLPTNLYSCQEAIARTGHGTTD